MNATGLAPESAAHSPAGFWRRRVLRPVRAQLTQGVSPDRIAATLGVGAACSLFPFLGFTSLLNLGAGVALRLNQPVLQTLNQLLGPVQLALILVYVRFGQALYGRTGDPFTVSEMIRVFNERTIPEFFQQFGRAGLHALTAWIVTAPFIAGLIFLAARTPLRRWARLPTP